eukprot:XP_014021292.1 PREDICTED: E3 ubiquitin-protein ligase MARCH4-like isoform X3 [Salmo salar]
MLRGLDMLKSRCCVLFGDLKVLLLRTPTPVSIPTTGHIPDSHVVPSEVSVPDNNTLTAHEGQRDVWTAPPPGAANGPERDRLSGWVDAAATEPSEVLHCSGSSDSWAKDKLEQRFSLCSYSESGSIRTPVCRICFQGPETWQSISLAGIEKVQIAAALLGSMFLVASLSWLVWSSFSPSARWQRHDLLFQICYGMYGFMDVVCFGEAEPYSSLQPWLTDSECNGWQLLGILVISLRYHLTVCEWNAKDTERMKGRNDELSI